MKEQTRRSKRVSAALRVRKLANKHRKNAAKQACEYQARVAPGGIVETQDEVEMVNGDVSDHPEVEVIDVDANDLE
jgi:hypothetical protein